MSGRGDRLCRKMGTSAGWGGLTKFSPTGGTPPVFPRENPQAFNMKSVSMPLIFVVTLPEMVLVEFKSHYTFVY